jgi:hypothetical protein
MPERCMEMMKMIGNICPVHDDKRIRILDYQLIVLSINCSVHFVALLLSFWFCCRRNSDHVCSFRSISTYYGDKKTKPKLSCQTAVRKWGYSTPYHGTERNWQGQNFSSASTLVVEDPIIPRVDLTCANRWPLRDKKSLGCKEMCKRQYKITILTDRKSTANLLTKTQQE